MWNFLGLKESVSTQWPIAHLSTQVLCLYLYSGTATVHWRGYLKNHYVKSAKRELYSGTVPGHQQHILNFRNGVWHQRQGPNCLIFISLFQALTRKYEKIWARDYSTARIIFTFIYLYPQLIWVISCISIQIGFRLVKPNNFSRICFTIFCTFLLRLTTWNFLTSRFLLNVYTRQWFSFSFS